MVITKSGDVTKQGSVKCSEENSVFRRVSLLLIISYLSLCGREWGGGGRYNFAAFRMGAYSRWALIRGWALIRINTVPTRFNSSLKWTYAIPLQRSSCLTLQTEKSVYLEKLRLKASSRNKRERSQQRKKERTKRSCESLRVAEREVNTFSLYFYLDLSAWLVFVINRVKTNGVQIASIFSLKCFCCQNLSPKAVLNRYKRPQKQPGCVCIDAVKDEHQPSPIEI